AHSRIYFFSTDTPPSATYTLSLHDALPIFTNEEALVKLMGESVERYAAMVAIRMVDDGFRYASRRELAAEGPCLPLEYLGILDRSEEHTSELQSRENLVCRLLLEKKKRKEK